MSKGKKKNQANAKSDEKNQKSKVTEEKIIYQKSNNLPQTNNAWINGLPDKKRDINHPYDTNSASSLSYSLKKPGKKDKPLDSEISDDESQNIEPEFEETKTEEFNLNSECLKETEDEEVKKSEKYDDPIRVEYASANSKEIQAIMQQPIYCDRCKCDLSKQEKIKLCSELSETAQPKSRGIRSDYSKNQEKASPQKKLLDQNSIKQDQMIIEDNHKIPSGLENLGLTCYLNAALQCLFHEDIRNHLKTIQDNPIINSINSIYEEATKVTSKKGKKSKNLKSRISELRGKLENFNPDYNKTIMMDSFFILTDIVNEVVDAGSEAFDLKYNYSTTCKAKCSFDSQKEEITTSLTLNEPTFAVRDVIEEFFNKTQQIKDYHCSNIGCKSKIAEIKLQVVNMPEILVLHFENQNSSTKQALNRDNFEITLSKLSGEKSLTYKLAAVVFHHGGQKHYIAAVEHGQDWYCFDDAKRDKVNKEKLKDMSEKVHVMIYVKK